jgi:hypothetical protein
LLINAVERQPLYGWEIADVVNGQSTFRFDVLSADGSYRPGRDQEVYLYENTDLLFGGMITQPEERGVLGEGTVAIITTVSAKDFKVLTQRRFINETIPPGSLKAALQRAVTYLPTITLDPAQVTGPSLNELVYPYVLLRDALDHWTELTGYVWDISFDRYLKMILPGSVPAPYDVLASNSIAIGDVTIEWILDQYANRVIARTSTLVSIQNDLAEQALHPVWEIVVSAPDTTDQTGLDALAISVLAHSVVVPKKVRYVTQARGLAPGQTQNIILPGRGLNGPFLIVEVKTRRVDGQTFRHVTALEGGTFLTDWRGVYRQWSGADGVTSIGGGSTAVVVKKPYIVGGSGVDAARSPIPDWIPATGGSLILGQGAVRAYIDTAERGGVNATVHAMVKSLNPGVSMQLRLYDVSASAEIPGVSTPIMSTEWFPVSFAVTLNPGAHGYELQVLPSGADEDVMVTAYVE